MDQSAQRSPVTDRVRRRGVRRGARWLALVVGLVGWLTYTGVSFTAAYLGIGSGLSWAWQAAMHSTVAGLLIGTVVVLFITGYGRFAGETDAELERLLRQEQATAARLAEIVALRREIVTQVSHEIRTPLTILQGSSESLLRRDADLPAHERSGLLEAIHRTSQRLGGLPETLERVMEPDEPVLLRDLQKELSLPEG